MEADDFNINDNNIEQSNLWKVYEGDDEFQAISHCTKTNMTLENAVQEVVHAFRAAAEREITLGDGLDVWILSSSDEVDKNNEENNHNNNNNNNNNNINNIEEIKIKKYKKMTTNNKLLSMKIEKRFYSLPKH